MGKNTIIYVDADNVNSYEEIHKLNYFGDNAVIKFVANSAKGNWFEGKNFNAAISTFKSEIVKITTNTKKNSTDHRIIFEMTKDICSSKIDYFYVISGDSDFDEIVELARNSNITVEKFKTVDECIKDHHFFTNETEENLREFLADKFGSHRVEQALHNIIRTIAFDMSGGR